jgi:hypothetical protein
MAPFSDNSMDYGAINVQLSDQVLQMVPKPMLQILCGENENLDLILRNCANHHTELTGLPCNYAPIRINSGQPLKVLQVSLLILDYTNTSSKIPWYDFLETNPELVNVNVGGGEWNPSNLQPPLNKQGIHFMSSRLPEVKYRSAHPNVDLNDSAPAANPIYAGDINASGIAASTNGMQWLIQQNRTQLDNNLQVRDIMDMISRDALRDQGKGITPLRYIESNLNFNDNLQLPLKIHFQEASVDLNNINSPHRYQKHTAIRSNFNNPPDWTFLKNGIDKNGAVSVLIGYYDKTNKRVGGDWITVN